MEQSHHLIERYPGLKLSRNFGDGIEFTYTHTWGKGTKTVRLRSSVKTDNPREATLSINSYAGGYDPRAVHCYVRISTGQHRYVNTETGEEYHLTPRSWEEGVPFGGAELEIEVTRRVDKRDIRHDKDMQDLDGGSIIYGRMKPDDWTHGYWTEEDAIVAGVRFFTEHFGDGWLLVPDIMSRHGDEGTCYASTISKEVVK